VCPRKAGDTASWPHRGASPAGPAGPGAGWGGWGSGPAGPGGGGGGRAQQPGQFGPFGLASRSALKGLWLCGDAIHPGEGTAGVSHSALMACRQILEGRAAPLRLPA
jgi:hypothetical protein